MVNNHEPKKFFFHYVFYKLKIYIYIYIKKKDFHLLKSIDSKLDMHKKELDVRNEMIMHIEKSFEAMKIELMKEKNLNVGNQ